MTVAEVRLWGRRIGAISWDSSQELASFEYDAEFQRSAIEVAPVQMPLGSRIYQFPELPERSFRGLPGMLADSLPDRFGNALIDAWLARQGRSRSSFDPVQRLCYVGARGMGALEYAPAAGPDTEEGELEVAALVALADAVLRERESLDTTLGKDPAAINQILQVGTSAGGARAKAIIAFNPDSGEIRSGHLPAVTGFSHWILKLDGVRSVLEREVGTTLGYGRIEYAYSLMAHRAGIRMSECRLLEEGERAHFMTRRFDRSESGQKLHLQSLAAIGHYDFNAAGECSQEEAIAIMRRLELPAPELAEHYRRICFNLMARNQDDHVKNIAFLMDKRGQWSLSPAYDLTWAYNPEGAWTSTHQMTVNGKRDDFTHADLLEFGKVCDLRSGRAKAVIDEVAAAIADWPQLAADAGVPPEQASQMQAYFRRDLV
ncbi:type II toxin-antitoxin system HipA family toxin [bacterium]|nr:MAG: type II toxin-antitoxin system HipA family toxin [bacterium]